MLIYDVHLHSVGCESGGILIGLEGEPFHEGVYSNSDLERIVRENPQYMAAYYITKEFNRVPCERVLKYHPRREGYSSEEVINDLRTRECKLCIIDTLYTPVWQPLDYYKVVNSFPRIMFIFAHMGGYDIFELMKIFEFNKNVYADFSLTQEYFGWCGTTITPLNFIVDMIDYCLANTKLRSRILYGSDFPFYSQKLSLEKYLSYPNIDDVLSKNFLNLKRKIQCI